MNNEIFRYSTIFGTGALLTVFYIFLYDLNENIFGNSGVTAIAAMVFLPAFVRLLGFLLIGFWATPFLFIGATVSLDFGLEPKDQIILAALLEVGAPAALIILEKTGLNQPTFKYLTGSQLLVLSLAAALGSAITHHIGMSLAGLKMHSMQSLLIAFFGNIAGTWTVIYTIKVVLTTIAKASSKLR